MRRAKPTTSRSEKKGAFRQQRTTSLPWYTKSAAATWQFFLEQIRSRYRWHARPQALSIIGAALCPCLCRRSIHTGERTKSYRYDQSQGHANDRRLGVCPKAYTINLRIGRPSTSTKRTPHSARCAGLPALPLALSLNSKCGMRLSMPAPIPQRADRCCICRTRRTKRVVSLVFRLITCFFRSMASGIWGMSLTFSTKNRAICVS